MPPLEANGSISEVHVDKSESASIISVKDIGMLKFDTIAKHFHRHETSSLWKEANSSYTSGTLLYDNEASIVDLFKREGDEIIQILNICGLLGDNEKITLRREKEVWGIKPDIIAIRSSSQKPGGDIEVKKIPHGAVEVMNNQHILGQVYNQMLVKEAHFGVKQPIAILTTLKETRVFWFESANDLMQSEVLPFETPEPYTTPKQPNSKPRSDSLPPSLNLETPTKMLISSSLTPIDSYQDHYSSPPPTANSSFLTPIGSAKIGNEDNSPPASGCKLIPVGVVGEEDTETEDDSALEVERPRRMFASKVYTQADSGDGEFLQLLVSVFMKMARVECEPPNLESIPLKSHVTFLTERNFGWRKASLKSGLQWSIYPKSTAKNFLVWQQLGHGNEGKALLVSTESGAVAVLKMFYSNNDREKSNARKEQEAWATIYRDDDIAGQVRVVTVDNKEALLMPHFYTGTRTAKNVEEVKKTLLRRFHYQSLVHEDVKWRNIGWRKVGNDSEAVVFDMGTVKALKAGQGNGWVDDAVSNLLSKVSDEESI
jgi:hypothetical protein